MSKTGTYKIIDGKLVKISDRVPRRMPVIWPGHNDPRTNGMVFENLGHEPTYISTKNQLREVLKRTGTAQKDA